MLEKSPVAESQSNGRVENAIDSVEGQVRALKLDLEDKMTVKLENKRPIWPWLIQYAAQTIHMYQINRQDGLTAAQRIRGRTSIPPRANLDEQMLYKPMKTVKFNKFEAKWRYVIWFGNIEHMSVHITL